MPCPKASYIRRLYWPVAGNFGDGLGSQDVGKNLLLAAHGSNLEPLPPPVHSIEDCLVSEQGVTDMTDEKSVLSINREGVTDLKSVLHTYRLSDQGSSFKCFGQKND